MGRHEPDRIKEAIKIGFPMDRIVGVWWSGSDDDARPVGPEAKGYRSLSITGVGQNYPALQDILKYVVDKGKSQVTSKDKVGEVLYNRAVLNAALIVEAIRSAQNLTGKRQVNGDDVRRGFEALNITDARWKEIGLPGFAAPIHLSCADHNGHGGISLVQWDGTKWNTTVPSIHPIKDKVLPMIDGAAEEYVKANPGWPKRTEVLRQIVVNRGAADLGATPRVSQLGQQRRLGDVRHMSVLLPRTEVHWGASARHGRAQSQNWRVPCRPISALTAAMIASPSSRCSQLRYPRFRATR